MNSRAPTERGKPPGSGRQGIIKTPSSPESYFSHTEKRHGRGDAYPAAGRYPESAEGRDRFYRSSERLYTLRTPTIVTDSPSV